MIPNLLFYDSEGGLIVCKIMRNDIDFQTLNDLCTDIIFSGKEKQPIIFSGNFSIFQTYLNGIYIFTVTRDNSYADLILEFLTRLPQIISEVFDLEYNKSNLKEYRSNIIELLDEVIDCGYPQIIEPDMLRLIFQKNTTLTAEDALNYAIMNEPWTYKFPDKNRNEIIIDAKEELSYYLTKDKKFIDRSYEGKIECCGGRKEKITLGFRKSELDINELIFHPCVNSSNFKKNNTITFIPPEGYFELVRYKKVSHNKQDPFDIKTNVEKDDKNIKLNIELVVNFETTCECNNFKMRIPLPSTVYSVNYDSSNFKIDYDEGNKIITASIEKIIERKYLFRFVISTSKNEKLSFDEPISLEFTLMTIYSGFLVTTIDKQPNNTYRRYKTTCTRYCVEISD